MVKVVLTYPHKKFTTVNLYVLFIRFLEFFFAGLILGICAYHIRTANVFKRRVTSALVFSLWMGIMCICTLFYYCLDASTGLLHLFWWDLIIAITWMIAYFWFWDLANPLTCKRTTANPFSGNSCQRNQAILVFEIVSIILWLATAAIGLYYLYKDCREKDIPLLVGMGLKPKAISPQHHSPDILSQIESGSRPRGLSDSETPLSGRSLLTGDYEHSNRPTEYSYYSKTPGEDGISLLTGSLSLPKTRSRSRDDRRSKSHSKTHSSKSHSRSRETSRKPRQSGDNDDERTLLTENYEDKYNRFHPPSHDHDDNTDFNSQPRSKFSIGKVGPRVPESIYSRLPTSETDYNKDGYDGTLMTTGSSTVDEKHGHPLKLRSRSISKGHDHKSKPGSRTTERSTSLTSILRNKLGHSTERNLSTLGESDGSSPITIVKRGLSKTPSHRTKSTEDHSLLSKKIRSVSASISSGITAKGTDSIPASKSGLKSRKRSVSTTTKSTESTFKGSSSIGTLDIKANNRAVSNSHISSSKSSKTTATKEDTQHSSNSERSNGNSNSSGTAIEDNFHDAKSNSTSPTRKSHDTRPSSRSSRTVRSNRSSTMASTTLSDIDKMAKFGTPPKSISRDKDTSHSSTVKGSDKDYKGQSREPSSHSTYTHTTTGYAETALSTSSEGDAYKKRGNSPDTVVSSGKTLTVKGSDHDTTPTGKNQVPTASLDAHSHGGITESGSSEASTLAGEESRKGTNKGSVSDNSTSVTSSSHTNSIFDSAYDRNPLDNKKSRSPSRHSKITTSSVGSDAISKSKGSTIISPGSSHARNESKPGFSSTESSTTAAGKTNTDDNTLINKQLTEKSSQSSSVKGTTVAGSHHSRDSSSSPRESSQSPSNVKNGFEYSKETNEKGKVDISDLLDKVSPSTRSHSRNQSLGSTVTGDESMGKTGTTTTTTTTTSSSNSRSRERSYSKSRSSSRHSPSSKTLFSSPRHSSTAKSSSHHSRSSSPMPSSVPKSHSHHSRSRSRPSSKGYNDDKSTKSSHRSVDHSQSRSRPSSNGHNDDKTLKSSHISDYSDTNNDSSTGTSSSGSTAVGETDEKGKASPIGTATGSVTGSTIQGEEANLKMDVMRRFGTSPSGRSSTVVNEPDFQSAHSRSQSRSRHSSHHSGSKSRSKSRHSKSRSPSHNHSSPNSKNDSGSNDPSPNTDSRNSTELSTSTDDDNDENLMGTTIAGNTSDNDETKGSSYTGTSYSSSSNSGNSSVSSTYASISNSRTTKTNHSSHTPTHSGRGTSLGSTATRTKDGSSPHHSSKGNSTPRTTSYATSTSPGYSSTNSIGRPSIIGTTPLAVEEPSLSTVHSSRNREHEDRRAPSLVSIPSLPPPTYHEATTPTHGATLDINELTSTAASSNRSSLTRGSGLTRSSATSRGRSGRQSPISDHKVPPLPSSRPSSATTYLGSTIGDSNGHSDTLGHNNLSENIPNLPPINNRYSRDTSDYRSFIPTRHGSTLGVPKPSKSRGTSNKKDESRSTSTTLAGSEKTSSSKPKDKKKRQSSRR